jgi:CRP-like cAMP-binding protein
MSFIATLSADLQRALESVAQLQQLPAGRVLIESGSCDSTLYFLRSGVLLVRSGEGSDAWESLIEPGGVVGEMAFLDNRPRTATVIAISDCTVLALDRQITLPRLSGQPFALQELISGLAALQRSRLRHEAADNDRTGAAVIVDLVRDALAHRAVRHPYLEALARGDLPDLRGALADFGRHYYGYSAHFPRYLTALISRLERPDHRAALLQNLTEESGHYEADELSKLQSSGIQPEWIVGIPHPLLFQRFRSALAVSNSDACEDHLEVICWREMFLGILIQGTPAEAVGALGLGTETIVHTLYRPFVAAIERLGDLSPADTVFFPLHTAVDDHHQATLRAIAADFASTAQGRADLAKGMHKALALRDSFWSWLHERARQLPQVSVVPAHALSR